MLFQLQTTLETLRFLDIVDIIVVATLFYWLYRLVKNTRALGLLKGLGVLVVINIVAHFMGMHTISWIMQQSVAVLMIALPIVFQPELRRLLEQLGSGTGFFSSRTKISKEELTSIVKEVVIACRSMSRRKIGALMVFERNMKLDVLSMQGTRIDGLVTSELLMNLFYPKSPLHDGAVIIRNGRIETAASLLPVSQNRDVSKELGTRHRSALGQSEESDALVVVVSEETGQISYALGGQIHRGVTEDTLRTVMLSLLEPTPSAVSSLLKIKRGESK